MSLDRCCRPVTQPVTQQPKPPCRHCRHCVLAAQRLGPEATASFLDETFLADRATSVRTYLKANPDIMTELPPPSVAARYGG